MSEKIEAIMKALNKSYEKEHQWKHCLGTMGRRYQEYNEMEESYWRSQTLKLVDSRTAALEAATVFDDMRYELHQLIKKTSPDEMNSVRKGTYEGAIFGEAWQAKPGDRGAWDTMDRWALSSEAWQEKCDRGAWEKVRYLAKRETRKIILSQDERMEKMFSLHHSWEGTK